MRMRRRIRLGRGIGVVSDAEVVGWWFGYVLIIGV